MRTDGRVGLALGVVLGLAGCGGPEVPQSTMPPEFPPYWSFAPPEYSLDELDLLAQTTCVTGPSEPELLALGGTALGVDGQISLTSEGDGTLGAALPDWAGRMCTAFGDVVASQTGRLVTATHATDVSQIVGGDIPQVGCHLSCSDGACGTFVLGQADEICWAPIYAD